MSQLLSDITLTLNTASAVDLGGYPASNIGWIVFINASPYACRATVGSQVIPMPAWYYYPIFVDGRLTGGLSVTPYLQTIPGVGFTKTLSTILYERHELPDNQSPQPLGGGPVDLTTATNILNTGNPVGTNIVFAQPLADGDPAGNVVITNSGLIEVGDTVHSGKVLVSGTHVSLAANNNIFPDEINIVGTTNQQIDLLISGSDATATLENQAGTSIVKLQTTSPALDLGGSNGAKSILAANNKPIQFKDSGGTARDVLWVDGSNQTNLQGIPGTDLILFNKSNGANIASAGAAGINLSLGGFNFLTPAVTANGSVSGTAEMYQVCQGTFKYTIVHLTAWRSASASNLSLPVPYTTGALVRTGGIGPVTDGGFKLLSSSVAQNINLITALAANGGTVTTVTQMYEHSIADCNHAFDQVAVWSNTNAHTGFILLEGV